MTIVEKIKVSLEMLGGVASLKDIYLVFKQINKDGSKVPQSSIRGRIYENCKTLDRYKGEDLFGSVYGKGEGVFSLRKFFTSDLDAKFIYELKKSQIELWNKSVKKKTSGNKVIISTEYKELNLSEIE